MKVSVSVYYSDAAVNLGNTIVDTPAACVRVLTANVQDTLSVVICFPDTDRISNT